MTEHSYEISLHYCDRIESEHAKNDLFRMLAFTTPTERKLVLSSLEHGNIEGEFYWHVDMECGCFVGTIAHARRPDIEDRYRICHTGFGAQVKAHTSNPIEEWFTSIRRGDTIYTNEYAAMAYQWIQEYDELHRIQGLNEEVVETLTFVQLLVV